MKKTLIAFLTVLVAVITCQRVDTPVTEAVRNVIHARLDEDPDTRTFLDGEGNVRWAEGDEIKAFMKSPTGIRYYLDESSVGATKAEFFTDVAVENSSGTPVWDHNVVLYPYSRSAVCQRPDTTYELTCSLPSVQNYSEGSFGNGTFPMVAVSETNEITFMNILGGMKLQLKGRQTIKSISVKGNKAEKLTGSSVIHVSADGSKPIIVMDESSSSKVTLDCGDGVKLDENEPKTFILALPPVKFTEGFVVTVTDDKGLVQTIKTSKSNEVRRSNLLVMPTVSLKLLVNEIILEKETLTLPPEFSYQLDSEVYPLDATDRDIVWTSSDESVAEVGPDGMVTAKTPGKATVTISAGRLSKTCAVTVVGLVEATADYIDANNVNHGKGVAIGDVVWAPVNCGYKASDEATTGYAYGLLYQWGRLYGQGYAGDETEPTTSSVLNDQAQNANNSNRFYKGKSSNNYDWAKTRNDDFWNTGTESAPVKTTYDPCPAGWRVPTDSELTSLVAHSSELTAYRGQNGYWFSGVYDYRADMPQVFLPAAGFRDDSDAYAYSRGSDGRYWSSGASSSKTKKAYAVVFDDKTFAEREQANRAYGYAVRCVQE
jgi:uncharacterized protein (TIGR02145 family)